MEWSVLKKSLESIGAKPENMGSAVQHLRAGLAKDGIRFDPIGHRLTSEIHNHDEAKRIEEVHAMHLAKHDLLGNQRLVVRRKELQEALKDNGFRMSAPGNGGSHQSFAFPETDLHCTLPKIGKENELAVKYTIANLLKAKFRDEEMQKLIHQPISNAKHRRVAV